jgi:hypothetical protein
VPRELLFSFAHVEAAEAGDYYQVYFDDGREDSAKYVLLQRQFEFPDGGKCYFESDDPDLCGHWRVTEAEISRDRLSFQLLCRPARRVRISFAASDDEFAETIRVLRIMLPTLRVARARAG